MIFLSLFSLSMIQSRASFIAAVLIGILLFSWTAFKFAQSKNLKEFFSNIFYVIPFCLALLVNKTLIAEKRS